MMGPVVSKRYEEFCNKPSTDNSSCFLKKTSNFLKYNVYNSSEPKLPAICDRFYDRLLRSSIAGFPYRWYTTPFRD